MNQKMHDQGIDVRSLVLTGVKWLAFCKFMGQLINWGMTLVVIRLLSPSDYGLMAMAMAFVSMVSLVNEMGLGASIVQAKSLDEKVLPRLFGVALGLNVFIFTVSFVAAPVFSFIFKSELLVPLIRFLSLQFLVSSMCVMPKSLLERQLNFKTTAKVDFFANILSGVVSLVLALLGYGVWALAWGSLSLQVFRAIFLNLTSPFPHFPQFSLAGVKGFVRFSGFLSGERVLWFIYSQADIFILGKALGPDLLGFYSVAKNLSSLPMQKISPIVNQVTMPAFSRIQNDKISVAKNLLVGVRMVSFLSFPVFLGLSSVSSQTVEIILGQEWNQAVPVLTLLCFVMPFGMVSGFLSSVTRGIGQSSITFKNMVFGVIVMPIAVLFGSRWGVTGVGFAWLFVSPFMFIVSLRQFTPYLGVTIKNILLTMSRVALISIVMFCFVTVVDYETKTLLSTKTSLFVLVLSGSLFYVVTTLIFQKKLLFEFISLLIPKN